MYITTYAATGAFYIGVRSCFCAPEDDEYRGSGRWVKFVMRKIRCEKQIIARFETRGEAELFELKLIVENKKNGLCMNERVQRYNSEASAKTRQATCT